MTSKRTLFLGCFALMIMTAPTTHQRVAAATRTAYPTCSTTQSAVGTHSGRVIRGAQLAARINAKLNRPIGVHLRRAFDQLERERSAKVNTREAWGVVGHIDRQTSGASSSGHAGLIRRTSAAQGFSFYEDNIELVWIPADSQAGYWLGTFYATHYDASGDPDVEMIINVEQQFTLPSSEGWTTTWERTVYARDRDRGVIQAGGLAVPREGVRLASFRSEGGMGIRRVGLRFLGRYGNFLGCGVSWCAGAAAGCGLANLWNAEIAWAPCTGAGCVTGFVGCTWGSLWDWQ